MGLGSEGLRKTNSLPRQSVQRWCLNLFVAVTVNVVRAQSGRSSPDRYQGELVAAERLAAARLITVSQQPASMENAFMALRLA